MKQSLTDSKSNRSLRNQGRKHAHKDSATKEKGTYFHIQKTNSKLLRNSLSPNNNFFNNCDP